MNDILHFLPRNERRSVRALEASRRKSGVWPPWEKLKFPRGYAGRGWAAEFETAHRNWVFSVLDRTLDCGVRHLAVSSLSGIRPSWVEMQRIKDELAGPDKTAVEVYPPKAEVVDEADMFHIWVLAEPLPFSLASRQGLGYTATGSKNGAARSGASTPAPGLTINLMWRGDGFD